MATPVELNVPGLMSSARESVPALTVFALQCWCLTPCVEQTTKPSATLVLLSVRGRMSNVRESVPAQTVSVLQFINQSVGLMVRQ